jgi:2-methylcitrate dehydratase PrpD
LSFANDLAARVVATRFADLPTDTVHWATVSITDTVGVAVAGSIEPGVRLLDRTLTGGATTGPCLLFGTARRVSALDAALVNGMAAHVLDFDASNPVFAGHATMHLCAVAFAAGEMQEVDGASFVAAYVAGFEAQSRIARGCQPEHSDKGWFASSTIGVFGATAVAGKLLGLSPERLALAFGIAANLASGLLCSSGTLAKPLAAGHSARNGLLAASLAKDGFTGALDAFEHRIGFLNVFDIPSRFNAPDVLADWGRPFEIAVTAVGLKQYPCCGTFHSSIDVLGALAAEHGLVPDDVERIEARLMTDRLHHVDRPDPVSALDAKFSAHYCLARTILNGRPRFADFEGEAFRDAATRKLMSRIHLAVHPAMRPEIPRSSQGGTEVTVITRTGQRLTGRADMPFGRSAGHPLPRALFEAKFRDCAGRALTSDAADELLAGLSRISELESLRSITDPLTRLRQPEPAT